MDGALISLEQAAVRCGPVSRDDDISVVVGENLRRLRKRNGLSLERLAKGSGVSRAMLGQIELGQSAPTINVLWKIARALDVPVAVFTTASGASDDSTVLRAHRAKWLASRNGRFSSRALFPYAGPRRVEFYEVKLAPQTVEVADAHPSGTTENIVLLHGGLQVEIGVRAYRLEEGDALHFVADRCHTYRNAGCIEAAFYLVMTYPDQTP